MRFASVSPGGFYMGGGGGVLGEKQVSIEEGFDLGVFPVTQEQWCAIMGTNPSHFSRSGDGRDTVKDVPEEDLRRFPVENVSWDDVQQFIERLNSRGGNWVFRLPTEAEWEFACRGGATSPVDFSFHFYLDKPSNDLSAEQANFDGNEVEGKPTKEKYLQRTSKVGSYKPNRLGLYDMHGNVWEWCADGNEEGSSRSIRGGSWYYDASYCQAANRFEYAPSDRYSDVGFRLVRSPGNPFPVVETWAQIEENLLVLESYLFSSKLEESDFAKDLIRKAKCLVLFNRGDRILVGPSRFVGYAKNTLQKHYENEYKDGKETNPAISSALDQHLVEDNAIEEEFQAYCKRNAIGRIARVTRKYWHVR